MRSTLAIVLCASASAEASSWAELTSALPELALPLRSDADQTRASSPLAAEDAVTWVIAPVAKVFGARARSTGDALSHSVVPGLWSTAERAKTRALLAGKPPDDLISAMRVMLRGAVRRPGHLVLVAAVVVEAHMFTSTDTYLLTWTDGGTFIAATLFAQVLQGEGGTCTVRGELLRDGSILRHQHSVLPLLDGPVVEDTELPIQSERPGRLLSTGRFEEGATEWSGLAGRFQDATSHEELLVFPGPAPRVFYRSAERKPWQALSVSPEAKAPSFTVRFAGALEEYRLAWVAHGAQVSCLNPHEKAQTFVRRW